MTTVAGVRRPDVLGPAAGSGRAFAPSTWSASSAGAAVAFAVIPMLWMLSTSLKGQFAALSQPPQWIPSNPTLAQYQTLLSPTGTVGPVFLRYFLKQHDRFAQHDGPGRAHRNSSGVCLLALPVSWPRHPVFWGLVRNMFPVVVFLIPLFILMRTLHLVNTHGH